MLEKYDVKAILINYSMFFPRKAKGLVRYIYVFINRCIRWAIRKVRYCCSAIYRLYVQSHFLFYKKVILPRQSRDIQSIDVGVFVKKLNYRLFFDISRQLYRAHIKHSLIVCLIDNQANYTVFDPQLPIVIFPSHQDFLKHSDQMFDVIVTVQKGQDASTIVEMIKERI